MLCQIWPLTLDFIQFPEEPEEIELKTLVVLFSKWQNTTHQFHWHFSFGNTTGGILLKQRNKSLFCLFKTASYCSGTCPSF